MREKEAIARDAVYGTKWITETWRHEPDTALVDELEPAGRQKPTWQESSIARARPPTRIPVQHRLAPFSSSIQRELAHFAYAGHATAFDQHAPNPPSNPQNLQPPDASSKCVLRKSGAASDRGDDARCSVLGSGLLEQVPPPRWRSRFTRQAGHAHAVGGLPLQHCPDLRGSPDPAPQLRARLPRRLP